MAKHKREHVDFQRSFFDSHVDIFKKPIPADVIERSREIVSSILPDGSVRLLDVGTGIGAFLEFYHERGVPYKNILGCDLSTEMLAEARRRFPEVGFWQGDVVDLPDDVGVFDLIVFNACFGNIFDQLAVLKNVRAHLAAGGRIAISHPMGNEFVKELQTAEPSLIHSLLPAKRTLEEWCGELQLSLTIFRDEPQFYLAIMQA